MTDELKPCPFCGGKALIWGSQMGGYIFGCDNIECFTALNKSCTDTHDEAVDQWNTRTPSEAAWEMHYYALKARDAARIAELEAILREMPTNTSLTAKLATARNEALKEAAKECVDATGSEIGLAYAEIILALETKEPTKPVNPDVVYDLKAMEFSLDSYALNSIHGVLFWWDETPEGVDYWVDQSNTPTQEGRDKIAAMREQFEMEKK